MVIRRYRTGDSTTVNITGSSFFGNYAHGDGGAVQLGGTLLSVAPLTFILERSVFEGNSANSAGGALIMYSVDRRVYRLRSFPPMMYSVNRRVYRYCSDPTHLL